MTMETTSDTYPTWLTTAELVLPVGMKFIYKYVIYDTKNNNFIGKSFPEMPIGSLQYPIMENLF